MNLIYIASPYTHKKTRVEQERFNLVTSYCASLLRDGHYCYSPIAHNHPIAQHGLPTDWEFWQSFDRLMIEKCHSMQVLQLAGWRDSKGIAAEVAIAEQLEMFIDYIPPVWKRQ